MLLKSHPLAVLDNVQLNFSEASLHTMNIVIAFIMFGVALELNFKSFREVWEKPKALVMGVLSQSVFMPALSFCLVMLINPTPTVALGMILVAACPGGNVSNFISTIAKANINLSVSLTAFSTVTCVFLTPFNFWFWGTMYANSLATAGLSVPLIEISFIEMLKTVVILLGLPIILGMLFAYKFPETTAKIRKPISIASMFFFGGFILMAFMNNFEQFIKYIDLIMLIVLAQNALALLTGYLTGRISKLSDANVRTLTLETGIHNSGLGLALIFNPHLFNGSGGMAFIAAWWGIWHIISGMAIAFYWKKREPRPLYEK